MKQNYKSSNLLPLLAFISLGLIWGSNFIYMKLAANLITPTQIVFFRVLFGFFPVLIYAYTTKALAWKHLKYTGHFLVMSLIATSLYYYGFAKGTSMLLSGVAGATSGSIPLFAFILSLIFLDEEKISRSRIIGVAIGFIGVFLIARPSGEDLFSTNMAGVLYLTAGSLSVGASFVYARKFITPLGISAAALTTYQLGLALLTLTLFTSFDGIGAIWSDLHVSLGLVIGLGLLGTGGAYLIYYYIVTSLGAIAASSVTYIPPVVALLIGAIIVGEPIEMIDYIATTLIFLGVFLLKRN